MSNESRKAFEAWYTIVWNIEPEKSAYVFAFDEAGRYLSEEMRNEEFAFEAGVVSRDAEVAAKDARIAELTAALTRISVLSENQQAGKIAMEALR